MAGDDVTIVVQARTQDAQRAFAKLRSEASSLKGSLIPLATAAVPLAAAMAPVAARAAGAGTALAAFGVAAAGQAASLKAASDAQQKYADAVQKAGAGSKQAAQAQRAVQAQFASMPEATQRAAVAFTSLKDAYKGWSDSLAGFTMNPVEKSFTLLERLMPKLTPMVEGASTQLDRLVSVAGGAMASPGFDALAGRVSDFANESLKEATDGIIHLARSLSAGDANGPVKTFMDFARANGPALRETLVNVGDAVQTLMKASADAGPGMLTLVNAALKLVAALPPSLVSTVMQLALALKAAKLAGKGFDAISAGIGSTATRLAAMRTAAAGAGGGLAGTRAAAGQLSSTLKGGLIAAGIIGVVTAVTKLSDIGRQAPPDVGKLTTSLGQLGRSGKASGEAARLFGSDLDKLYDSVRSVSDPALIDNVQQGIIKVFSLGFADSTPVKEAKERLDGIDESLTNLVQGGKSEVAAAAFARLSKEYVAGGGKLSDFTGQMDSYKSALADQKFEQDLVADSMGIFGQAAQDTSAKLDAQKSAADGLRQALLDLNDVNRSAYDAQIGFEGAMDDLTKSFKDNGATLDLNTEKGRANGQAMSAAAAAQDEFIAAGVAAGDSLGSMSQKSDELRSKMVKLATEAFDGNKKKAQEYVNTLLGVPGSIDTLVKAETKEAKAGLSDVVAAIRATPDAKTITVDALNGAAIKALEKVGIKTKQLPDGKTQVLVGGNALGKIDAVRRALANLNGKTATTWTYHNVKTTYSTAGSVSGGKSVHSMVAAGGMVSRAPRRAAGGMAVQLGPEGLLSGPGSTTSDSILALFASGASARVSDSEFVVNAQQTKKHLPLLELINSGRLAGGGLAKGGVTKAEAAARKDVRGEFGISYFGTKAGYKNDEFRHQLGMADSLSDLVTSLNKWRSTIKATTHGVTESKLLKQLDKAGASLIKYEKKLTSVNSALDKAKDKLASLKDAAAQMKDSVKSGIISGANITRAATAEDSKVTINTLLSQARGDAAQAQSFEQALADLKKKGVSGRLLEQISEAGITGGGLETAQALLGASPDQIKELNKLNQSVRDAADKAGSVASDALYGAGIKAAEGLVAGLTKKKKDIEAAMLSIAKGMEKSIKKALGIKSPSTVMMQVGHYAAEGFAHGIRRNRSVRPAWESMLNVPRAGSVPSVGASAAAASGAGAGGVMVVKLAIGSKEFGEVWVDTGRREVHGRGGVKATLGRLE
ncbi:phage tail protein [Streptomyces sp. NPDC057257]|uniref:phage tail protein n=1 Tax=Streptomyces sp. NPDC057257 TaxID=3346071 RepID=UPI003639B450